MSGPRKKPNSGKHVFLKNSSSGTDQRLLDADFDRYWDDESKNNNRNRIRVGRQYQATVPPLLKPGEADGRRCEDLETLKWKPDQEISDEQLDNYLSVVKAVSLFAKAINICQNPDSETGKCLQNALRGLSEFVTSHHPKEFKSGCQVSPPGGGGDHHQSSCASSGSSTPRAVSSSSSSVAGDQNHCNTTPGWDSAEGNLFLKALEVCGKNFATIKKDFFPWKPVKNLIDYYYCGQKGEGQQKSATGGSNGHRKNCDREATASALPYPPQAKPFAGQATEVATSSRRAKEVGVSTAAATATAAQPSACATVAAAASVPAEPVSVSLVPPSSGLPASKNRDTVGSLKFYLDGEMVLKLNARPGSSGVCGDVPRCRWVQSKDRCQKPPRVARRKRRRRQVNGDGKHPGSADQASSDSDGETGEALVKRKMLVPCVTTVVSPKPAWTPPVEKDIKCVDSALCEDSLSLHGS